MFHSLVNTHYHCLFTISLSVAYKYSIVAIIVIVIITYWYGIMVKLSVCTYNIRGFNSTKVKYINDLLEISTFVFLQEVWLNDQQMSELSNYFPGYNVHGVSAIDSSVLLKGRPKGGVAVIYPDSLGDKVSFIKTKSNRLCSISLKQDQFDIDLFCVYMPWDCNEINNLNEFESILNEISALCITNNTFNGTKSFHKRVTCGVPQGSILGPLFFLAYMNDIYNASQLLYNILYADDTCIYLSGNELSKLIKSMNSEIKLISDWLKANKLTLNIDKTYYMVFHRGRRKCFGNTELFIDNIKIKQTETMKYLGVIIDTKLNWISHITLVKNKVAKGIGIIRRARPLLNKSALRNLYHTFIYPYLTYCVEVWGSAKSVHLSPILLLQKKIIRLITFSERLAHTEPIFLQLNILPIDKLIQDRIGLFMYKMFHGLHPPTINNLYIKKCDVHNHNTRHRNYLHVSMAHSDLYAKNFYCSSILIWNEIMNKIDVSISFPQFKILLKHYLLVNSLKK